MTKYVVYSEMSENGQDGMVVRIPVEEAISRMMRSADLHGYKYESEAQALQDFIAVNWAAVEDEP